jgi:hypothetical protein
MLILQRFNEQKGLNPSRLLLIHLENPGDG